MQGVLRSRGGSRPRRRYGQAPGFDLPAGAALRLVEEDPVLVTALCGRPGRCGP
jgi:hypothetical protein